MIYFYQKSETTPGIIVPLASNEEIIIKNTKEGVNPTFEEIYFLPKTHFQNYYNYITKTHEDIQLFTIPEETIEESIKLPLMIGRNINSNMFREDLNAIEVIEVLKKEKKRKLAITIYSENNFFLDDTLAQAAVLKDLYKQLKEKNIEVDMVMYKPNLQQELTYKKVFPELKLKGLPAALNDFCHSDLIISDSSYQDEKEKEIHDVMAKQMCFDLSEDFTLDYSKDIRIENKARGLYKNLFDNDLPIICFNPVSNSKIRTIPENIRVRFINKLLDKNKFNIISLSRENMLDIEHKNYKSLAYFNNNIETEIAFISASDGLLTVDSGIRHAGGHLNVPTYTIYSTIKPEYREKYYTQSKSFFLENEHQGKIFEENLSDAEYEDIWLEIIDLEVITKEIVKMFKKGIF